MPTAKNLFQIHNLHPKKHIFKEKKLFFLDVTFIPNYQNKYQICILFQSEKSVVVVFKMGNNKG